MLRTEPRTKRMLMTMSTDAQLQAFLGVMKKEGVQGRLWPGLVQEVRVRAEAMTKRSNMITVLDVDPESDKNLVMQAMAKYGEVKKCKRMTMPGIWKKVIINKVKVELGRNEVRLPNIIHAFGTTTSADDFATWKMRVQGMPQVLLRLRGNLTLGQAMWGAGDHQGQAGEDGFGGWGGAGQDGGASVLRSGP